MVLPEIQQLAIGIGPYAASAIASYLLAKSYDGLIEAIIGKKKRGTWDQQELEEALTTILSEQTEPELLTEIKAAIDEDRERFEEISKEVQKLHKGHQWLAKQTKKLETGHGIIIERLEKLGILKTMSDVLLHTHDTTLRIEEKMLTKQDLLEAIEEFRDAVKTVEEPTQSPPPGVSQKPLLFIPPTLLGKASTENRAVNGPGSLRSPLILGCSAPLGYPEPPNFTGRKQERQMLTQWLLEDREHPLLSLVAIGGMGKSHLAWRWLQ